MLIKLLGYEMKAFGRIILPLYAATMGMALITGLSLRFLSRNILSSWIGVTVMMGFSILIIATMVMTGVLCVQRFYQNLLGSEGYLMFSLPVGTHELILSKVLGSLIWTLLGGVAAILTAVIMGFSAVPFNTLRLAFRRMSLGINGTIIREHISDGGIILLIGILMFAAMLMQIYAALSVGHQWSSHRILGSVVAYFVFDLVRSFVSAARGKAGVTTGLMGLLFAPAALDSGSPVLSRAITAAAAAAAILIYSFVTWYFLDKRLNLE